MQQDAPMGDPVDTIAQMLGLDLSSAASPDQQGQMVVSAVETLVLQLHQYYDQYGPVDGVDDPNDGMNPEEESQSGDEPQDGEDPDQEEESSEDTETDPNEEEEPEEEAPPVQKKKGFAASFESDSPVRVNPRVINGLKKAREVQLISLAQEGYITPVMLKELKNEFCNDESLSLSLSLDDNAVDDFDKTVSRFIKNGRILALSQETFGSQDQYRTLSQHRGESDDANALVKSAEAIAEKRKEQQRRNAR